MNSLVREEHDRFTERTITRNFEPVEFGDYKISFRHISDPDADSLVMDIDHSSDSDFINLSEGIIIIRLNNQKNYKLKPHESYRNRSVSSGIYYVKVKYEESDYCHISKDLLHEIAESSSVEIEVMSGRVVEVLNFIFDARKREMKSLAQVISLAQVMYNALYDENAYADKIKELEREAEEAERKRREERIKENIKFRNREIKDKFGNFWIPLVPAAIIAVLVVCVWELTLDYFSWYPIRVVILPIFLPIVIVFVIEQIMLNKEYEEKE